MAFNFDGDSFSGLEVGSETDLAVYSATKLALDEVLVDHATTACVSLDVEAVRLEHVGRAAGADRCVRVGRGAAGFGRRIVSAGGGGSELSLMGWTRRRSARGCIGVELTMDVLVEQLLLDLLGVELEFVDGGTSGCG